MNLPAPVRDWLHRRGWIASPSLAFMGVPFGPQKRDLAGEVMAAISRDHDPATCPMCSDEPLRKSLWSYTPPPAEEPE